MRIARKIIISILILVFGFWTTACGQGQLDRVEVGQEVMRVARFKVTLQADIKFQEDPRLFIWAETVTLEREATAPFSHVLKIQNGYISNISFSNSTAIYVKEAVFVLKRGVTFIVEDLNTGFVQKLVGGTEFKVEKALPQ